MRSGKPILLLEDDQVDVLTVKRALREIKVLNDLHVEPNGEDALKYLHEHPEDAPCIILLDLNMPRMNGTEFLRRIKQDPEYKKIPVIVLTTSREEQDRISSFNLGVAGYMIKPVDYLQFVEVIRTINLYWSISELPT